MRRKPIFSAEDGVLNAWSLEIFYGEFTRRDWSFPGGCAIEMGGGALTHGRRLLGSKRVSDFHAGHARHLTGPNFYSPFPIADLAVMDDIGDLCKRDLRGPTLCW